MKNKIRGLSPLFIITSGIILMILLPSLTLLKSLFEADGPHWDHIKEFLLKAYLDHTLVLILSVGLITAVIGTYLSWTLSHYHFRFKKLWFTLLILPMAIPPYIGGYIYGGIFNYGGTLERIFRSHDLDPIHINILSMNGAIFVFSLFLMPYVILITKSFFAKLPSSYYESGLLLGHSPSRVFRKVILPLSLTAILGGTVLVMLEVLNDFGLVSYFGITTFSTAIYKTWFGLGDVASAIRLASILMVLVFVILSSEHFIRRKIKVSQPRALSTRRSKYRLSRPAKGVFGLIFSAYTFFALLLPVGQLLHWTFLAKDNLQFRKLDVIIKDTISLALTVTLLVIICGLIIGNYARLSKYFISKVYARIVILGYSIPASIIAVAVLSTFINTDRFFKPLYQALDLKNLFLTSSLIMLTFALTLRFMAIGFNSIESGFNKMGKKYYEASLLLGQSPLKTFFKIDLPLLAPALFSAFILTFVDVLKELPLTLILRPFNYNTLATQVYTYANDEMIHEASFFALIIIGISMLALLILNLMQKGDRRDKRS